MKNDFDLIIVGGGISGAIAGISAARENIKTLIIDQNGFLGGMLTGAGVGPMMTFHSGSEQVIQGITGELIDRLKKENLSPGHLFDTTGYTYTVTPFDLEGMKWALESMFLEAGGHLLYHTMLADVQLDSGMIQSLTICNKGGLSTIKGSYYIDATGDADLSAWSGVECTKGRESDGMSQPLTMKVRMYGVDMSKVRGYIHSHPEEFPRLKGDTSIIDKAERLSIGGFVQTLKNARASGDFTFTREDILFFETNNPGEVIINTSRITGLDSTNPFDLSKGEVEGRKQAHELARFFRKYISGFENAVLEFTGPSIGIRSSRQIEGLYRITKDDILEGRKFEDAVVCNGYPIDVHSPTGEDTFSSHLAWGDYYTIPYRALVNKLVGNLITVGRCISGDFEAQAAFRTTPGAGAIGHAGGAASVIAVRSKKSFAELDYKEIQDLLRKQNAFLPLD
ncbi:FAD-dependent oxidoreductase [Oceanispirochaeta sp.]|uniref:FAD-dependent oxidoreductase n=1 Tax=Oceanispirochaeta sp. TaxID=2035350 RepID=UPI00260A1C97|nr:FAD-dependent oxidoreductase [Oceanispirochaeta sp.]MDA3955762.1 FAD-dependent oxidoreductase [Oceanispirochaeta sp.]